MSEQLATSKEFQERVFEKIRESIGELLTEAELKTIVEAAMQKALFEPRVEYNTYGSKTSEKPSVLVEEVGKLLKDEVAKAVKTWFEENPETIAKIVDERLAQGITGIVASQIDAIFSMPLQMLRNELMNKGLVNRNY